MRVWGSCIRVREGEGNSGIDVSSTSGGVDESTGLSREEMGGRSYVDGGCPGRERFLVAARLFWNQAFTVFVSLNRSENESYDSERREDDKAYILSFSARDVLSSREGCSLRS